MKMEETREESITSPNRSIAAKPARFSRKAVVARGAAAIGIAFAFLAATASMSNADPIDDLVRNAMAKKKIPGLAVAVIRDNKVLKEKAYGFASLELGVPVTLNTPFVLASMTKIFTASAIMLLVQEGKITLDEPVVKLLPQLPAAWSDVTIRHCLVHTSGLPDAMVDDMNVFPIAGDRDELFNTLAKMSVKPVGEKVVYNQTEYVILGMIIEKISGMSYEEFVQSRLLKPAHLTHASFGDAWSIIPGRSDLYTADDITKDHTKILERDGGPVMLKDKILRYGSKASADYIAPAGLLNGSIQDLVNWEKTLEEGKLLTKASLQEMMTPYKLKDGKDGDFGLGYTTSSFGMFAHSEVAYAGGAATWCFIIPEKHLKVIVLTNLQGSSPSDLAADILALYAPELTQKASH
jgi:D-alanyl-D-alanine carboxypeptidase